MHYREKLHWILDKVGNTSLGDDALYQRNIDFVHSLGLKCDCVGWCKLDLDHPRAAQILDAIEEFCRSDGWTVRGYYSRELVDVQAQWFELQTRDFLEHTVTSADDRVPGIHGQVRMLHIRACNEITSGPKAGGQHFFVPERVRRAVEAVSDLDIWWLRDRGRYEGEQYFALMPRRMISSFGVGEMWMKKGKKQPRFATQDVLEALGGWAPKVGELFSDLQVELPNCYFAQQLPEGGMVWAVHSNRAKYFHRHALLLHRDVALRLLEAKALKPKDLRPALVAKELGPGYTLLETTPEHRPTAEALQKNWAEYEAFRKSPRPKRQVTEKQALTQLRRAKRDRAENFHKPLPKAKAEALAGTVWEPLLPYCRVTDGGVLDVEYEYELLAQKDWVSENTRFQIELRKEELEAELPCGIKFGRCADGDTLLLCEDGTVVRFGHEEPVVLEQWPSLHQFIFDALTGMED